MFWIPLTDVQACGKELYRSRTVFAVSIRYQICSEECISSWYNVWAVDKPLADQFSDLFRCTRDCQVKISDYTDRDANHVLWGQIFRTNLLESKERHLFSLLDAYSRARREARQQDLDSSRWLLLGEFFFCGPISWSSESSMGAFMEDQYSGKSASFQVAFSQREHTHLVQPLLQQNDHGQCLSSVPIS